MVPEPIWPRGCVVAVGSWGVELVSFMPILRLEKVSLVSPQGLRGQPHVKVLVRVRSHPPVPHRRWWKYWESMPTISAGIGTFFKGRSRTPYYASLNSPSVFAVIRDVRYARVDRVLYILSANIFLVGRAVSDAA